jgi:hypothetical protein
MIRSLALLILLGASAAAAQQMPDGSANRAAMEKVSFAEGRWTGQGWFQTGPGRRDTAVMVETVERKLDGSVFLIEGRGTVGQRVVHHALAILAYDPQKKSYTMRSWLANGVAGEFPVTVTDDTLQWFRDVPGGRIRNTARYSATEWIEVGEFSRDGTTWTTMMEIRLHKQP